MSKASDRINFFTNQTISAGYSVSPALDFRNHNQMTLFMSYASSPGDVANVLIEFRQNGEWFEYGQWRDDSASNFLEYEIKPFQLIHGINAYLTINESTADQIRMKARSNNGGIISIYGSYYNS